MTAALIRNLDTVFPYFCFFYGAVMTVVLNSDRLNRLADERLPATLITQWRSHRAGALICLFVGAFWILQNLWVT